MKQINEFIKLNYKLLIPILLILLLFIVFFIYYQISTKEILTDTNDKFYQYFYGEKYNYEATITTNKKNEVVDFKPTTIEIEFDSTPIYYQNKNKVILPQDMSIVMPTLSCAEYLSKGYSVITYENNIYNLTTKKYNNKLNHYFLYDSKDLYFFIENVILKVNEQEITLSPFSYVIYENYNNTLSYYDKENDKYETIANINSNAIVSNDYYTIHVDKDYLDYYGSEVLLTSGIENLNTIDMKD